MAGQELRSIASSEACENLEAITAAILRRDRVAFRLFQRDYSLLSPEERATVRNALSRKNRSMQ